MCYITYMHDTDLTEQAGYKTNKHNKIRQRSQRIMVQMAMMPMTDRSAVGAIGPSWQPPVRTQGASHPERDLPALRRVIEAQPVAASPHPAARLRATSP